MFVKAWSFHHVVSVHPSKVKQGESRNNGKGFVGFFLLFLCYFFLVFFTKWKTRNLIPSLSTFLAGGKWDCPHLFMGRIPTLGQMDLSEQHSRSLNHPQPKVCLQPACRNMPKAMSTTPVFICCQPVHIRATPMLGSVWTSAWQNSVEAAFQWQRFLGNLACQA